MCCRTTDVSSLVWGAGVAASGALRSQPATSNGSCWAQTCPALTVRRRTQQLALEVAGWLRRAPGAAVPAFWTGLLMSVHYWHHVGSFKTLLNFPLWKMLKMQLDSCSICKIVMWPYMLARTDSWMKQKFNTTLLSHIDWLCASWLCIDIFLMQRWRPSFLKGKFVDMHLARSCILNWWFNRLFWSHSTDAPPATESFGGTS